MSENILFFFSALGVFNTVLLSIYLVFVKARKGAEDYLLATLLLFLVIRVGVSCFNFFGEVPKEAIKLGLIANLLLGPGIFYLMQAFVNFDRNLLNQFITQVGGWILLSTMAWFMLDFDTWDSKIRFVIHSTLTVYLLYIAFNWRGELWKYLTGKKLPDGTQKATVIYFALVLVCMGFAMSLVTSYVLGPLIYSIVFYFTLGYFVLVHRKAKRQYALKPVNEEEFIEIHHRLKELMESDKLYQNPDLSLDLLANKLSISKHLLSQVLNDNLQKNFHQYINQYRVEAACVLLKQNKHYSIEAVGHEVGFHSRSSFFASFKKLMGVTPSQFRND